MSDLSVTNTFVALTTAVASQVNQNYSDIVNYINNRDDGTATWDNMNVTATVGNPVTIKSNQSTTEVAIDNTAVDGDPQLTFKLSGAQTHVLGVDDSDSKFLKLATTGITTNVAFQIPTSGAQVQFASVNSASIPAITFIGNTNTGFYQNVTNEFTGTIAGTATFGFSSSGLTLLGGVSLLTNSASANIGSTATPFARIFMASGTAANPAYTFQTDTGQNTGMFLDSQNGIGFSGNGVELAAMTAGGAANDTALWVYDVTAAGLIRVTRGAADSGGAGFRLLRVVN